MSKRKRKVKSSLGHDPFETMTDFEIEGPAPEVQELTAEAPQPRIRRAFKKVQGGGEKPKAFAIADFFTSIMNPPQESEAAAEEESSPEESSEEIETSSFLADEATAEAEPAVAEDVDEEQLLEEAADLDTAVFADEDEDQDEFDFDITRISFAEPFEELEEEADEFDTAAEELPTTDFLIDAVDTAANLDFVTDERPDIAIFDADEGEANSLDEDEDEPFEPEQTADELPETAVLTIADDAEEIMDEDEDDEPSLAETAVLIPADEDDERETDLLIDELPETAVLDMVEADANDTILAIETDFTAEDEDEEDEDGIFPTAAELRGILDTAELAFTAEHKMALSANDDDDDEDEDDVWGTTSPLDPDLSFEWADDDNYEEDDGSLPNWLTDNTSAEKFDTDPLNPFLLENEPSTAEPDLDFTWDDSEQDDDESLPEWLTAETAASKIDTDKLNPDVVDTAKQKPEADVSPSENHSSAPKAPELYESASWLKDNSPDPDWLAEANERYADEGEADDELLETPDWLTAAADDEENEDEDEDWFVEGEEEEALDNFEKTSADTAQLTSSLLNDWLESTAHEADADTTWFTAPADEPSAAWDAADDDEDENDAADWVAEQTENLNIAAADDIEATEDATDDLDDEALELPEWIDTEDSFALAEADEDDSAFPADMFDFAEPPAETAADLDEIEFVGKVDAADLDEIEFDFDYYKIEEEETTAAEPSPAPPNAENDDLAFDVADFAFEALESDAAEEDLNPNLDEILNRFSNLPETQVLNSPALDNVLGQEEEEVEEDLFDFNFDRFELARSGSEEKDLDDLVKRLATLPVTQQLQTSGATPIDPTFADEAESNVLISLLKEIDAEMGVTYPEGVVEQMMESALQANRPTTAEKETPFGMTKGQFVVFILGDLAYAFPLDQVEEIAQTPEIDAIPNVPRWVRGVTDINNNSVSVIDLRRFFGIRSHTKESSERVLVVHDAEEKVRAGLLVDEVKAIRNIPNGEISPLINTEQIAPTIRPYTYGFYNKIILLDINRLFDSPDMAHIGLNAS